MAAISINNTQLLTLPTLRNDTRYQGMPRRYEDTKPVLIQNFTHGYIMGLGEKVHKSSLEKFEVEKTLAVKSAEQALWARAEVLRRDCIEKALSKAKGSHDKELKKQQRAHDRMLKDELFKLDQELRLLAAEQLKKEKEEGSMRLNSAVQETERRCEEIRVKAVAEARVEERQKSLQEIEDLKREFQEKHAQAAEEWREDKAKGLSDLRQALTKELELAVACAHHEEQVEAQEMQAKLKQLHEQSVRVLNAHIAELKAEIKDLENKIEKIMKHKRFIEEEVLVTRQCFQSFIDDVRPFEPGKSEYVMPPLRMQRTESLFEFELPKKDAKK